MPDRFVIHKIPDDEWCKSHWKMVDTKTNQPYYLDTKKACEERAEEIVAIEDGRLPQPEPPPEKKVRRWEYEGLWVDGNLVDLEGLERARRRPKERQGNLFGG